MVRLAASRDGMWKGPEAVIPATTCSARLADASQFISQLYSNRDLKLQYLGHDGSERKLDALNVVVQKGGCGVTEIRQM